MSIVNIDDLKVGDVISFTSRNPMDNVLWQGTITGICAYNVVQHLRNDLVPYYQETKKVLHDLEPVDKLEYLVLSINQEGAVSTLVMAKDWIEPTSVIKIEISKKFDIRIYDLDTEQAQTVLDLLRANGFKSALVS